MSEYDWSTEAQHAYDAIANLDNKDCDNVYRATQDYTVRAIAAAAASGVANAPPGGGNGSLTDLTDVTGTPGPGKSPVGDNTGQFPLVPVTTQDDLDAVLATVAGVVWHDIGSSGEPAFQPNWRNIGDPWSPARYRHLANSTVRLQGTVTCDDASIADSTWVPIFQLPAPMAPDYNLEFMALTNDNAISRMYVWEDGSVVWAGYAMGPHAPVSRLPLNFLSWSMSDPT